MRNTNEKSGTNQRSLEFDRVARLVEIRQMLEDQLRTCALRLVQALFQEEVENLCGKRFCRKEGDLLHRGGTEDRAVIYLDGQRMRVRRPRVRGPKGEEMLESYQALQDFDVLCEPVKQKLIRGISTLDYEGAIQTIEGGLGLKRSSVSRAFIRASQKDLDLINGRDLSGYVFVAIFLDGLEFHGICLLVGMGVTIDGKKLILGVREGSSENERICVDLFQSLNDRGFKVNGGILTVIDGGKGLHAAVKKVWGEEAQIQRCQEHKKRNILDYLPKSYQAEAKRRLKAAWGLSEYEVAKAELIKVEEWLEKISCQVAASLREGTEETLTIHKLKLPDILRRTFSTTNPIESAFSIVRERSRRVKNWARGQVSRWSATCLLEAERRMKKIRGYRYMTIFVTALNIQLEKVDVQKEVA